MTKKGASSGARPVILQTLRAQGRLLGVTRFLAVLGIEIAFGVDAGHVVHRGGHGSLDARIQRGGVQRHAAPAADADDADARGIDALVQGQKVHGRHEVLGVDVRGGHIAGEAAALAGEGGVEGQGQKAALGHGLGVQAGALLLHRAEGAADRDGREPALPLLGDVEVRRQGDAVAVDKGDLLVPDLLAPREGLVPGPGELQFTAFHLM